MDNDLVNLDTMTESSFSEVEAATFIKATECSPGQTFTGALLRVSEGGEYKNKLYSLKTAEGEVVIWGTTNLDSKMSKVKVGQLVRISYEGSSPAKNGKQFHTWKVAVAG